MPTHPLAPLFARAANEKSQKQPWWRPPLLDIPIVGRLALGFLLAALLSALVTGTIGLQRVDTLSQESNIYRTILQQSSSLDTAMSVLQLIQNQVNKNIYASQIDTYGDQRTECMKEIPVLIKKYDQLIQDYIHKALPDHSPGLVTLLNDHEFTIQIVQQRVYVSGVWRSWTRYDLALSDLLSAIQQGNVAEEQEKETSVLPLYYADASSSLHSLIRFNSDLLPASIDKAASRETYQQFMITLLGSLLAFIGTVSVGVLISRTLVNRLKQLHQVTKAVEHGQIDARVKVHGTDEIADVSASVNVMLDSLVNAMRHTMQAKEQLDLAYEQQRQLNQMKDQFILNVSHEFRTPLTQVYGFLQLLQEYSDNLSVEQRAIFIEQATHGSEELIRLVDTILDARYSNREIAAPQLKELVLSMVVQNTVRQIDPREAREHPIQVDIPTHLFVFIDKNYLIQIIRNIIANAIKYTPASTPILIYVSSRTDLGSQYTILCIQDKGPGIPPDEQPLLFQKFARLQRDLSGSIRGTGLGLYICKQLIEAMNGRIWVESSGIAGEGCCFCLALPVAITSSSQKSLIASVKSVDS
ncbi:HAMP domain-containing sensor histidine kinase [Tengunoibacter tsumagoiensis]|uniref:histidine kinase n=1 Tax=Tengunoibacter tsumagoiensis TaxID=2014871 RepID=A0A402AA71_9CHLR|nr:HAMP domain-containing sensor histidine kinase [Tengunoibacter tsumagoiensis]GCE16072.1 hypothetical protein KTT_59310 [Tengunoibacter tsumagoiensis]